MPTTPFRPTGANPIIGNILPSVQYREIAPQLTSYEIACIEDPTKLGIFYRQGKFGRSNMLTPFLLQNGNEMVRMGNKIIAEEIDGSLRDRYDYPGLVTVTGNDFTLNTAVFTSIAAFNQYMSCDSDPDKLIWVLPLYTEIRIQDTTGKTGHGIVTGKSTDNKTITVVRRDDNGWADFVGRTDLAVELLATDDSKGYCGDCIAVQDTSRFLENSFRYSVRCYGYDEQDWAANSNFLELERTGKVYHNMNLDHALYDEMYKIDKTLLWGDSVKQGSDADLAGLGSGMTGMMEQLLSDPSGAIVNQGYIETLDDLFFITDQLDEQNSPKEYIIKASREQYNKLQRMMISGMNIEYNPYCCDADALNWFNFKKIEINDYTFYFQKWDQLSSGQRNTPQAVAGNPHYIMIPMDYKDVRLNNEYMGNEKATIPYINIVWQGRSSVEDPWKFYRKSNEVGNACTEVKVTWHSKYSLLIVGRNHFVVGLPVPYSDYSLNFV